MPIVNRLEIKSIPFLKEKWFLDLMDTGFGEILNIGMIDAPDVAIGSPAEVGFQLRDIRGNAVASSVYLELGVYDNQYDATPAATAVLSDGLNTAIAGTVIAGGNGPLLEVMTDATGLFKCALNNAVAGQVFIRAKAGVSSPVLDCREIDSVTFS